MSAAGRVRSTACGALVLAALAAGCEGGSSPWFGSTRKPAGDPATFHVNNGNEPEYLDPGKCADGGCAALVVQLFEGLTRRHPADGHPIQGVAESWAKSDDNRRYRFRLRHDARWSDGRPVTAHDFEYAWKRVLWPKTASRASGNLAILWNGEAYRLGKLRVLQEAWTLRTEAREDAPRRHLELPPGTALRILERAGAWARVEARSRPFGGPELPRWRFHSMPEKDEWQGWVPDALLDAADDGLLGVRATDALTLDVVLERPAPYFLDLVAYHAFAPVRRDVIEPFAQRGEEDLWTRPGTLVSNGPYVLDRWAFQYEITMKENPFYWDRQHLAIRRIAWMEVQDYHASMNLYKAGELDWVGDNVPPPAEYQPLLAGKRDTIRTDGLSVYWYELNTRKPPLDDDRVRRALNRAVDKRQLVERVTRGGQTPATHYVPDFTGGGYAEQAAADREAHVDPFVRGSFDPEEARAALSQAGYVPVREGDGWRTPGFPPLEILYNTGEGHRAIAVAIQAMWKEHLGISVSLRNLEWKVMLKAHRDGDFQIIRLNASAEYDHPHTFLEGFLGDSPQNRTGWRSERFEQTLERASETADPRESIRLYREAEAIAVKETPRIPLYFYTRTTLVKPWVKGFRGNKMGPHAVQFLSIDPGWERGGPDVFASSLPELSRLGSIYSDP